MNPITAVIARYKLLFEIVLIGALALVTMWGVHMFLEHERDIGRAEVQALWNKQIATDQAAARVKTAELAAQADEARKNGADREQTIRTLATATGSASNSLRDTLAAIRGGVPSASQEALAKSTTALAAVLTDCQGRYRELAEKADRHASDAKTLDEAWPK